MRFLKNPPLSGDIRHLSQNKSYNIEVLNFSTSQLKPTCR